MMCTEYDETIEDNPFFQQLQQKHDLIQNATLEGWIICVPRSGTIQATSLTNDDFLAHILVPSLELPDSHYTTLNKQQITVQNKVIIVEDDNSTNSIHILFDETFYIGNSQKYKVWCIESPLTGRGPEIRNNPILNLQDSIDLLWSESLNRDILEQLQEETKYFLMKSNKPEMESLEVQRDLTQALYNQCLQTVLKNARLHEKTRIDANFYLNLKIALETYIQHSFHNRLFGMICNCKSQDDAHFNKIVRNLADLQLRDFNIAADLFDYIPGARRELSRINQFTAVLSKLDCLKRTIRSFSSHKTTENNFVTADVTLQLFTFLIIKTNVNNWIANLTYLTDFKFTPLGNESSFIITSLEAAIEYIKGGELFVASLPECERMEDLKPVNTNIQELFQTIKFGELEAIENFFNRIESCHPLCSCEKCTKNLINQKSEKGFSPLHIASIYGHPHVVEFLLGRNASVDAFDHSGATPLHYTASRGHQNALLLLLHGNASVNVKDYEGNTPLHLATNNGHESCVKALLYFCEGKNGIDINSTNNCGDTPLHFASKWGYANIVHILLQYSADADVCNRRSQKPIDLTRNFQIEKMLMIDLLRRKRPSEIAREESPLAASSKPQNLEQMKKVDLMLKAVENNDLPLTCFYLNIPGPKNVPEIDSKTTCHPLCSCDSCSWQFVENEPSANCDLEFLNVNVSNGTGHAALHVAAKFGRTEILRLLLDAGASVNLRTSDGSFTALHLACLHHKVQIVRELVKCGGCDFDLQDAKGNTAIHYAALKNNARITELLLNCGVDCGIKNNNRNTPLQEAANKGHVNVIKLLRNNSEVRELDESWF